MDRLEDIEHQTMMPTLSSDPDAATIDRRKKFKKLLLSKLFVSETQVERVFSKQRYPHENTSAIIRTTGRKKYALCPL